MKKINKTAKCHHQNKPYCTYYYYCITFEFELLKKSVVGLFAKPSEK